MKLEIKGHVSYLFYHTWFSFTIMSCLIIIWQRPWLQDPGIKLVFLPWKHGLTATGLSGNSSILFFVGLLKSQWNLNFEDILS